jgi:protease I
MNKIKKAVILTGPGFDEAEVIVPWLYCPVEGIQMDVATSSDESVVGKHGFPMKPTIKLQDLDAKTYDAVFVAGGYEAPDRLRQKKEVLTFVSDMFKKGKIVAAICHGPWVLVSAGVLKGKKATCYKAMKDDLVNAGAIFVEENVVIDGNLITSNHPTSTGFWVRASIDLIFSK